MAIEGAIGRAFRLSLLQALSSHVFKIALYEPTATLSKDTKVYQPEGEVAASGAYQPGGKALTGFKAGLDGDTAYLEWDNPVWGEDVTITAGGAQIYDASRGNGTVAILNFRKPITSTHGTFRVTLPRQTVQIR